MAAPLSNNLAWNLANPLWAATLNPVIANMLVQGNPVTGLKLTANKPLTTNTGLGRQQIGFIVTDIDADATVWRTQPFNSSTLTIEASADCTVNLWMY